MALFRRNNKNNVPAEIQEYYQTERRERAGIAWLLAFGTLVVTVLLAAGIFYGGRWAWREIAGNDDPEVAQNGGGQEQQQPQENPTTQAPENQNPPENTPEQNEQETPAAEQPNQEQENQEQPEQAPAESEQPGRGAGETEQETPAAGDQGHTEGESTEEEGHVAGGVSTATPETVPNTGPGDTAAIFAAVSVLGYIIHRLYARKAE